MRCIESWYQICLIHQKKNSIVHNMEISQTYQQQTEHQDEQLETYQDQTEHQDDQFESEEQKVEGHLRRLLSSNDPDVKNILKRLIKVVNMKRFKIFRDDPGRSDMMSDIAIYYLFTISRGNRNKRHSKSEERICPRGYKLITLDIHQKVSSNLVEVVCGNDYTYMRGKELIRFNSLVNVTEVVWTGNEDYFASHVLVYSKGKKSFIALVLNKRKVLFLERKNWDGKWKEMPTMFDINDLRAFSDDFGVYQDFYRDVDSDLRFYYDMRRYYNYYSEIEFYDHFLIILYPFVVEKVKYKDRIIFEQNDSSGILLCLSVDLFTLEIKPQLFKNILKSIPVNCDFGYHLTPEQREGEKAINYKERAATALDNYFNSFRIITVSERSKLRAINFVLSRIVFVGRCFGSSFCESIKHVLDRKFSIDYNDQLLFENIQVDLGTNKYGNPDCGNSENCKSYKANNWELINKIVEGDKLIWCKKRNGLFAKQVHYYIDDDKWLIIVLENNTFKFLYRASNSDVWVDKSTEMFNTEDLKVIRKNSLRLSRIELKFNFTESFCMINLGDAVTVSYKDFSHNFEDCGEDVSVWFIYDVKTNKSELVTCPLKYDMELTELN
ncbi:hypothetical protein TpMuguga_04g00126 [Theileria parva strain Muguga]|uniref:Uncharacterized protein n=1 Tax=Theileria parva TaxID=5875 RepID=Q4N361_THEPA|nr:uncharacterized protein TpMuguga_04g00126 [Theileria parva strain Muguga]EAN31478.1 hypothetical protein TpMuguga_04g00126 [Theileria parva strain Muguga]|eukprot:XP_763761.1 hypothetical protein [Theileria parva strain Muguga]